jgi:hypothetical protein
MFTTVIRSAALLVAHTGLSAVRAELGAGVVAAIVALALTGAAWLGHTERSAQLRDVFLHALLDARLSRKAAAIDMGLTPSQLSDQVAGQEHLSCWRLAQLSDTVLVRFGIGLVRTFGGGRYAVLEERERQIAVSGKDVA